MMRETVKIDSATARAIIGATGKGYGTISEEIGYSVSYITYVLKSGTISATAFKALKAICGIDLEPAVKKNTPMAKAEEPTTITVRIELSPETVQILENYSYERTADVAKIVAALDRLAAKWN